MTKQLDDMWSSRWVLPEHREALLEDERSQKLLTKPELDEQLTEEIFRIIEGAARNETEVSITVFDSGEFVEVTGYIQQVDTIAGRLKFIHGFQRTWVPLVDIIKIDISIR